MMELTKPLTTVNVMTLSKSERIELANCETTVAEGRKHFVLVGNALLTIRDSALYRGTHKTFENYLREKWDMSREYGYKTIEAAKTVENLTQMCPNVHILPDNEAQARALSGLAPEQQQQVWQQALKASEGNPTARVVRDVAQEYKPTPSVSSKPGDKRQVPATPITLNSTGGTQEEAGADYRARWQAETERADKLQDRVRALEDETARLQARIADLTGTAIPQTGVVEDVDMANVKTAPRSKTASRCPLCGADDLGTCPCDSDKVTEALEKAEKRAEVS
jgi:hypothetical protein